MQMCRFMALLSAPPSVPRLLEDQDAQGRQDQAQGSTVAVERLRAGLGGAGVAETRPPVFRSVAVQELAPEPALRHADAIALVRDGRKVADDQDEVPRRAAAADIADDAVVGVVEVDPLEPGLVEVELVEGRLARVKAVEVPDPALDAAVPLVREDVPFQALLVA